MGKMDWILELAEEPLTSGGTVERMEEMADALLNEWDPELWDRGLTEDETRAVVKALEPRTIIRLLWRRPHPDRVADITWQTGRWGSRKGKRIWIIQFHGSEPTFDTVIHELAHLRTNTERRECATDGDEGDGHCVHFFRHYALTAMEAQRRFDDGEMGFSIR